MREDITDEYSASLIIDRHDEAVRIPFNIKNGVLSNLVCVRIRLTYIR